MWRLVLHASDVARFVGDGNSVGWDKSYAVPPFSQCLVGLRYAGPTLLRFAKKSCHAPCLASVDSRGQVVFVGPASVDSRGQVV